MGRLSFDGRVAVVTGAGRGMGRTHALLLASRGAKVVVNDLGADIEMKGADPGPAPAVVAEIEAAGGEALANTDSVATRAGAEAMVAAAVDRWGRIDIVINNAGGGCEPVTIDKVAESDLRLMIDVHLFGAFFTMGAAWPHMVEQGYGRFVNTSSAASFGLSGEYAYAAAKAGLIGVTKSVALDGAQHGIKANALLPVAMTRLCESIPRPEVREWVRENFRPEQVSAAAVAMAHESVPFSGEAITAGRGHVARVFFGVSPGFIDPELTPEQVLEHADEVMTTENFVVGSSDGSFMGNDAVGKTGQGWLPIDV